ncbi:MAG: hypothetical protein KDD73_05555 [Anaerolineales bacterium]|nr:hypothetical protein [Anaerolineales bacterium]MCB9126395.1 hypothetical protein [Ardenticatenales bacterium]MCB9171556.1 hypothetical protein [Ardenticatenales bacterium]
MNYYNTFIRVAADCPAAVGTEPPERAGKPTMALIQYRLIDAQPYTLTQEELLWQSHVAHKGLSGEAASPAARDRFFSKPMACMRASALGKRYGWGLHFDDEGHVALHGVESAAYQRLATTDNEGLSVVDAMRNQRG